MPKRFTLIIVATLVILLLLVIFKPYTVTYDKELSKVEGVSLMRIRSDGHSSSSSSGGNKLEYTGGTLQDILAVLTDDSYPIIELAELPKGYYSINAKVDSNDKDLSKKVYDALSGAFNLKVSVRPILVDSYILTCPDQETLTIQKTDVTQLRGFYEHTTTAGNVNVTYFIDSVDSIAWVRLQLFAMAYNIGNFLRRLALPKSIKDWSLRTMREKLVKIRAKVVSHARYVTFQMAEVLISKSLFYEILERINRLKPVPIGYD